jgi:preprotein translocase subunit SecA
MDWLGMKEGIPIEHPWITKAIEGAQKKVEDHNFELRKQILKYDDVRNVQRTTIYEQRNMVLDGEDLKGEILEWLDDVIDDHLELFIGEKLDRGDWDIPGLIDWVRQTFIVDIATWSPKPEDLSHDEIIDKLTETLHNIYEEREKEMSSETMRRIERIVMLDRIDDNWIDHLYNMDYLEEGVHFVAYGQKDPLLEFKREGHNLFSDMILRIKEQVVEYMFKVRLVTEEEQQQKPRSRVPKRRLAAPSPEGEEEVATATTQNESERIGRNDPCPCGSGKKYKKCHGR